MKLLLCGDFVRHSGFARVNEAIAAELAGLGWDVAVLAVNYMGDAHALQQRYRLYPAALSGDAYGIGRIGAIVAYEKPDVILVVNDPWICQHYLAALGPKAPPVVLYMPVDGTDLREDYVKPLNTATHAIAYTVFGQSELQRAGLTIPCSVIPHGIDTTIFHPVDRDTARGQGSVPDDWYIVLVLDRNQPRKRLDLAFRAFAQFAHGKPDTVKLVYHGAINDIGWNVEHLARRCGIADRLVLTARDLEPLRGLPIDKLKYVYGMADVKLATPEGEGWGLTTMEAMACKIACIAPDYAAYGEWAQGGAMLVPCADVIDRAGDANTVGGIVDVPKTAYALELFYRDVARRMTYAQAGYNVVTQPFFQWDVIGRQFDQVLRGAVEGRRASQQVQARITTRPETIDSWVVEQVIERNEYGLGALSPDDLVIDVGAHIGAFSLLAHHKGSRRIEAYEPDADNYRVLNENVGALTVEARQLAVWRSDVPYPCEVLFIGHDGVNTGAGNTVYGDGQCILVQAIALDTIIGSRHVAVLKIDAESAEWPILLTSQRLDRIALIVGEYHEVGGSYDQNQMTEALRVDGYERYLVTDLVRFLQQQGFEVTWQPYVLNTTGKASNMGGFRAVNMCRPRHTNGVEHEAVLV